MRRLVLIGGGHAHLPLLRQWARRPLPGVLPILVNDHTSAVYSGMTPGVLEGIYRPQEAEIPLAPLAARAGARFVHGRVRRIDPRRRRVEIEGQPPLEYDVCSLDVGSRASGDDSPGVREHTLPMRPIHDLAARVRERLERLARTGARRVRILVVGAGAAGIELGLAAAARSRRAGLAPQVCWIERAPRPAAHEPPRLALRLERALRAGGHRFVGRRSVVAARAGALVCADGSSLCGDLLLWCTGAAPQRWLATSGLPATGEGWVAVEDTLEVRGHPGLFAAGDCAAFADAAALPRAGVHAVRQAAVLAHNVRARLRHGTGAPLRRYRPQRSFLRLVALGGRRAVGARGPVVLAGHLAWRLKDAIDRRFVARHRPPSPGRSPAGR